MIGQYVGIHQIDGVLGRGGMAVIYSAHDPSGISSVAIKMLRDPTSLRARARLENEARILAEIAHEGLVKLVAVLDCGEHGPALVMERLHGESMRSYLQRLVGSGARRNRLAALRLVQQAALILGALHQAGVVHRDIKPENLWLSADPIAPGEYRVKILDFGIARKIASPSHLTEEGAVPGTPKYMAPEQLHGEAVSPAMDVYALGLVFLELRTGELPPPGAAPGSKDWARFLAPLGPESAERELLEGMLEPEATMRLGITQVAARIGRLLPELAASGKEPASSVATESTERSTAAGSISHLGQRTRKQRQRMGIYGIVVLTVGLLPEPTRSTAVRIEGGTFFQGSTEQEVAQANSWCNRLVGPSHCPPEQYQRELPRRQARVSAFFLDRTEVCNREFAAWLEELRQQGRLRVEGERMVTSEGVLFADVMKVYDLGGIEYVNERFRARSGMAELPVIQVTWDGALAYCVHRGMRLPYEVEWEFAARQSPDGRNFPWGDAPVSCEGVVFARTSGERCQTFPPGPAPVGTAAQDKTPQGIHDLGGNVGEWLMDRFEPAYAPCPAPCQDPRVYDGEHRGGTTLRVVRGGDWHVAAVACRSAGRSRLEQARYLRNLGFRCAMSAE